MKSLLISKIINSLENLSEQELKQIWMAVCPHEVLKTPKKKDDSPSAVCAECNEPLGWYCPDSPDNQCVYYSEPDPNNSHKRVAVLRSGKAHPLPSDHDSEYETDDSCLFCGQPDERK